jgi:hypothetical protein
VPTNGLIGEWKLDETGGTIAHDTKNDFDASVQGGAAFVAGTLGRALNLNNGTAGTGSKYAEMPSNTTLNNVQEGNYTIAAWFYPYTRPPNTNSNNGFWAIVSKYGQHMGIVYNSLGRFVARHYLTGNVLIVNNSSATYPINDWYHVTSVVSKTAGTVKVYVNGDLMGTETFTPNTAAREYGSTPFRIGRAETTWAADGMVDQVRIYNVALNDQQIEDLYNETSTPTFRFPVGMSKGQQFELLGMANTPDGHMAGQSATTVQRILDSARVKGARVVVRVTPTNSNLLNASGGLDTTEWKNAFDGMAGINANSYLSDGTLIGLFAIDEPFTDFNGMTGAILEQLCRHQKSKANWSNVPCFIRDLNTKLYENRPAGGTYQYVDAGWAQIADHHYVPAAKYNGSMGAYFRDNLAKGDSAGVGLMYGFNLLNGGKEVPGCAKPVDPNHHNCAMSAGEIRAMADTLAAIGDDEGCGVNGWEIDPAAGPERDYFFGQGDYVGNGIPSALQYLHSKVSGLRPGVC